MSCIQCFFLGHFNIRFYANTFPIGFCNRVNCPAGWNKNYKIIINPYGSARISSAALKIRQSSRGSFRAGPEWREIKVPFSAFMPYRIDVPLDLHKLRRLGIVAIGSTMTAELCVAEISFYLGC